jgi:hypothetical protein
MQMQKTCRKPAHAQWMLPKHAIGASAVAVVENVMLCVMLYYLTTHRSTSQAAQCKCPATHGAGGCSTANPHRIATQQQQQQQRGDGSRSMCEA